MILGMNYYSSSIVRIVGGQEYSGYSSSAEIIHQTIGERIKILARVLECHVADQLLMATTSFRHTTLFLHHSITFQIRSKKNLRGSRANSPKTNIPTSKTITTTFECNANVPCTPTNSSLSHPFFRLMNHFHLVLDSALELDPRT